MPPPDLLIQISLILGYALLGIRLLFDDRELAALAWFVGVPLGTGLLLKSLA